MKKDKNKKQKEKKERIDWKRTWRNNIFMLRLVWQVSPGSVIVPIFLSVIGGVESFLTGTYLYKYALNAIQEGKETRTIVASLGFILLFSVCYTLIHALCNYYCELRSQKVCAHIDGMIYKKATEVELACFENAEFYDKYIRASSNATGSAWNVIGNISHFVYVITSVSSVGALIIAIDPVFILVALIPLISTIVTGKKRNRTYAK